ncbi:hypothetical protein Tco_0834017 [Tanacetum coccineum]
MPKHSTTQFDQVADDEYSLLMDDNDMDRLVVDPLSQKKTWHEDKDQDPPIGSDQGKKKRRTRKDVEPSMKSLKSKESAKDQLDWKNPEGRKRPVDMSKPLPLQDKEGNLERKCSSSINKTLAIRAMINRVSKHEVFSTMRILSVVSVQNEKIFSSGYLKEILVRRADKKLYKFKEGDFLDIHLNDIEDMILLIAQNKLYNLEGDVIVDFLNAQKMFTRRIIVQNRVEDVQLGVEIYQRKLNLTKPQRSCPLLLAKVSYTQNFDPPGVIYEDKSKKKRLMRADELHKFCDVSLQTICNILHERLQNFRLGYNNDMPTRQLRLRLQLEHTQKGISDEVLNIRVILHSIHSDDGNSTTANIKQALWHEILLNLNLPDHKSVLTEPEVHVKMEMDTPHSSRVKFITAFSYSVNKYKDMMKAQVRRRSDKKEYVFNYANLPRLSQNDIEDMYLLNVQD